MRALLLAGLFALALPVAAEFVPAAEQSATDLPPGRTEPVPVEIDFFLLEVTSINGADETFGATLYLSLKWRDDRMRFDAVAFGNERVIYHAEAAAAQLAAMWSPAVNLENLVGEPSTIDELLTILADGTVEYERRLTATFRSPMDLARFPFDQQVLEVRLESFVWDAKEVRLVPVDEREAGRAHVSEKLAIRGWNLLGSNVRVDDHRYVTGDIYSRYVSSMLVQREPYFYLWSVVLPLVMVTFFAITCFLWDQETLSERIAQVLTCLLTVTAQSLAVDGDLPRISYLTPIDVAFLLTYATLVLVAVISLWTKRVAESNPQLADVIDLRSAWMVSLGYTLGMGLVFWI